MPVSLPSTASLPWNLESPAKESLGLCGYLPGVMRLRHLQQWVARSLRVTSLSEAVSDCRMNYEAALSADEWMRMHCMHAWHACTVATVRLATPVKLPAPLGRHVLDSRLEHPYLLSRGFFSPHNLACADATTSSQAPKPPWDTSNHCKTLA